MSDKDNKGNTDMPENVELQFHHTQSPTADELERQAAAQQAASEAPGEYKEEGLDRHDVGVEDTMVASDPPSTNMGGDDGEDHGRKEQITVETNEQ